jgi:hypothetical protein
MLNTQNKSDERYVPSQTTRAQVQIWIDNQKWFEQRHGHQKNILLAIAKDCGYTALPKCKPSMKALIGNHIAIFFSEELAWKFNKMVDEL